MASKPPTQERTRQQAAAGKLLQGEALFSPNYPEGGDIVEAADIKLRTDASDYIIKCLTAAGEHTLVYGPSGCGKTFMVVDMALHVAVGRAWRGHRVRQAFVLYVASESPRSAEKRVKAWLRQHGYEDLPIAFALWRAPVNLLNDDDVALLAEAIKVGKHKHKMANALLVVDTLARATPGLDENESGDMGAVIGAFDRLRATTGAASVIVHHSGKDEQRGARGHSSLRAAVDCEIAVSAERIATVTKSRDDAIGSEYAFRLEPVVLETDAEGDDITSCELHPIGADEAKRKPKKLPQQAKLAFDVLRDLIAERAELLPSTSAIPSGTKGVKLDDWRERYRVRAGINTGDGAKDSDAFRQRWRRALQALQDSGHVCTIGTEYAWLGQS